jgi:hypothetical protein
MKISIIILILGTILMFNMVILMSAKNVNDNVTDVENTFIDKMSNISNKVVIINTTILQKKSVEKGSHYPQEWIFNYSQGRFYGTSMEPAIFENNWILTKDVNLTYPIKQGDIVRYYTKATTNCDAASTSFDNNDDYVIHRVIRVNNKNMVFVKGDNNEYGEYIKRCQITSVVVGVMFT